MHAMPLLLGVLCVLAIAYRYYSAFLAARVAVLDDSRHRRRPTLQRRPELSPDQQMGAVRPSLRRHLRGRSAHRAGAGHPVRLHAGPVWLVIGVCLAGAVQDMLVLAASVRRGGKSLAEIARTELGRWPARSCSAAILFIVVIALAGLGFVVVKALGGEEVKLAGGMRIVAARQVPRSISPAAVCGTSLVCPPARQIVYPGGQHPLHGASHSPSARRKACAAIGCFSAGDMSTPSTTA